MKRPSLYRSKLWYWTLFPRDSPMSNDRRLEDLNFCCFDSFLLLWWDFEVCSLSETLDFDRSLPQSAKVISGTKNVLSVVDLCGDWADDLAEPLFLDWFHTNLQSAWWRSVLPGAAIAEFRNEESCWLWLSRDNYDEYTLCPKAKADFW